MYVCMGGYFYLPFIMQLMCNTVTSDLGKTKD